MVNLLESMHKCCLPSGVPSESPGAYEKSLVYKIFGGCLRSQVHLAFYIFICIYLYKYPIHVYEKFSMFLVEIRIAQA